MKIKGTVLICEKNKGFLTALSLLIQREFEEVVTECEHEKILSLIQEKEIDIIVLDTGSNTLSEQKMHIGFIKEISACRKVISVL